MACEYQDWSISRCPALYVLFLAVALLRAAPVVAAGVVGTETPGSCTEAALDAALVNGGLVTFDGPIVPAQLGEQARGEQRVNVPKLPAARPSCPESSPGFAASLL